MRKIFFTTCLVLCAIGASAQDTLKMFLNENFEVVTKNEPAVILRKSVTTKEGYHISYQYVDGRMIETGVYSSLVPKVENGPFSFFNMAGQLYAEGTLAQGRMSGTWVYYGPDWKDTVEYHTNEILLAVQRIPGSVKEQPAQEQLAEYVRQHIRFPGRMLKVPDDREFQVTFVPALKSVVFQGQNADDDLDFRYEITRVLLDIPKSFLPAENGTGIAMQVQFVHPLIVDTATTVNFAEDPATFEGKDQYHFAAVIQKIVRDAEGLRNQRETKKVTVAFRVRFNGKTDQVKLVKSCGVEKLDERVLEAVRNSDDWKPARLEGRVVNQTFMVPFNF